MKAYCWIPAAAAWCAAALNGHAQTVSERFYQAIRSNDLAAVKTLAAADANVRDPRGATPLMYAAAFGNAGQMKLLLDAGAGVNAANAFKATALIWAKGDPEKSRLLIAHGADVNVRTQQGRTPLIAAASYDGGPELVRLLLAKGAAARAPGSGDAALLVASKNGDVEVMKLLLDAGASVNASSDFLGDTALMDAVHSGNLAAVRLLLARGADVNAAHTAGRPVMRAGASVEMAIGNHTALTWAAPWGSPEMIRTLLGAGADVNTREKRGMTPLMLAVASETQDVEVVKLLIQAGADVNVRSLAGETPLDWARKFGSRPVIRALEEAGAKCAAAQPSSPAPDRQTPPDAAAAVAASVALLQRSSTEFFKQSGCVGCHHQPMTSFAVRAARKAGIAVDESAAREQSAVVESLASSARETVLQGLVAAAAVDELETFAAYGHAPDMTTDSIAGSIAALQRADGSWHMFASLARSPLGDGPIAMTAHAVIALRLYPIPARQAEFESRIARARTWLLAAQPHFTDEAVMRLRGLASAGADRDQLRKAADALIAQQRPDGGWAGNPNLASDAFSTARVLYALRESGTAGAAGDVHQRGVRYLLRTQFADGSWHVPSRAVKFQPYFQSGFPFDHDQWISAAATAYAVTALAAGIESR